MGVIETAQGFIGKIKYVFGSENIEGGTGDCSAFTQYVFGKNGVSLGRNTESQWLNGEPVNEPQRGDLVFFSGTYDSNYKDGVSHVGIYEGGGNFIHLSSGGVKESSLNSSYYSSHYLGARRYSGSENTVGENGTSGDFSLESTSDGGFFKNIFTIVSTVGVTIVGIVLLYFSVKES